MFTIISDVFFFSSRRRHTRYWRDWSSDVCSSDLGAGGDGPGHQQSQLIVVARFERQAGDGVGLYDRADMRGLSLQQRRGRSDLHGLADLADLQLKVDLGGLIGRASGWGKGESSVG